MSDDKTNTMAVVTEFQVAPFIIRVGEDIASKLEKGNNSPKIIIEKSK